jgi:hypothetical protein
MNKAIDQWIEENNFTNLIIAIKKDLEIVLNDNKEIESILILIKVSLKEELFKLALLTDIEKNDDFEDQSYFN